MDSRLWIGRALVVMAAGGMLAGCVSPPAAPAPAPVAPASLDLLHSKVDAYNAGLEAGKRLQARRDAVAVAAARADCAAAAAPGAAVPPSPAVSTPPAPSTPAAANPTPPPAVIPAPIPPPSQAPIYTPGGPAVPLSTAQ